MATYNLLNTALAHVGDNPGRNGILNALNHMGVNGTAGPNVQILGNGNGFLSGGDGADNLLSVGSGNHTLSGGDGSDYMIAGAATGNNTLDGGTGNDFLAIDDTFSGHATLLGGDGNDLLYDFSSASN